MSAYIIAYDIHSAKRLRRLHRYLTGHAFPLQYSVFLFKGTDSDWQKCLGKLTQMIDVKEDDLRCYPLPKSGQQACLGQASLPEGIYYSGQPACETSLL